MTTAYELRKKQKNGERIVDECKDKVYMVCGKRTNKNVWELQQLYESTQAKTPKVLPEFFERIRYMIVKGILKATYSNQVDQESELFHHVVETILNKIIPKVDKKTGKLVSKYHSSKANLGACILNTCYWSVRAYQGQEQWCESFLNCSDFLEDYDEVSTKSTDVELGQLKFISDYEASNTYVPIIQDILQGDSSED